MAHEMSRTIESDGFYYNVSGITGDLLEGPFNTLDQAVESAKARSARADSMPTTNKDIFESYSHPASSPGALAGYRQAALQVKSPEEQLASVIDLLETLDKPAQLFRRYTLGVQEGSFVPGAVRIARELEDRNAGLPSFLEPLFGRTGEGEKPLEFSPPSRTGASILGSAAAMPLEAATDPLTYGGLFLGAFGRGKQAVSATGSAASSAAETTPGTLSSGMTRREFLRTSGKVGAGVAAGGAILGGAAKAGAISSGKGAVKNTLRGIPRIKQWVTSVALPLSERSASDYSRLTGRSIEAMRSSFGPHTARQMAGVARLDALAEKFKTSRSFIDRALHTIPSGTHSPEERLITQIRAADLEMSDAANTYFASKRVRNLAESLVRGAPDEQVAAARFIRHNHADSFAGDEEVLSNLSDLIIGGLDHPNPDVRKEMFETLGDYITGWGTSTKSNKLGELISEFKTYFGKHKLDKGVQGYYEEAFLPSARRIYELNYQRYMQDVYTGNSANAAVSKKLLDDYEALLGKDDPFIKIVKEEGLVGMSGHPFAMSPGVEKFKSGQ